ncbi:MAG TPA: hypothetical protein VEU76_08860 [Candidatus Udaeobacter sp.]|nr:hypothetical protein [Candidatus Udaeobacter sp.]
MGSSAREIEREIRQTRERLDTELDDLESQAASRAVRYGRVAAIALGAAAAGAAAFLVWRKTRKPSLKDRLDGLSVDSLRELAEEIAMRFKEQLPSVTVRVNEEQPHEPGTFETVLRKVAPAVIGTASSAVLERIARTGDAEGSGTAPPQAD